MHCSTTFGKPVRKNNNPAVAGKSNNCCLLRAYPSQRKHKKWWPKRKFSCCLKMACSDAYYQSRGWIKL